MLELKVTLGDILTLTGFVMTIVFAYSKFSERITVLETTLRNWIESHEKQHVLEKQICDERHFKKSPMD